MPMSIVNKLFCIIFARYRRKLGDLNIESAWFQANSKVTVYLGSLVIAAEFLIFLVLYFPLIRGTAFDRKPAIVALGTAICLLVAYSVSRGFRAYLSDPPRLDAAETSADTRFIFWFRAASIGSFGSSCLLAFAMHRAGFPIIR